jgi:hypothetical protein
VTPAQYRLGGDGLEEGVDYHCPMQIVLTDARDPDAMITDLVRQWVNLNDFKVEPLWVRSHEAALELFIEGRGPGARGGPGPSQRTRFSSRCPTEVIQSSRAAGAPPVVDSEEEPWIDAVRFRPL